MLVLTEEAYTQATESSPNGNGDGDVAARAGVIDPGSGGVSPDRGVVEFSPLASYPQPSSSYLDPR
jgi:hypothetical protein